MRSTTVIASSRTSRSCTSRATTRCSRISRRSYLGVLARRTLITTNVVRVLEAANGKPIIFMPARHDHHRVQTGDGYAAYVAGADRRRSDRRDDRRAGVVVGRQGRRDRAALADRVVRRQHRARGDEVRRVGAGGPERDRARRLRERLGEDRARGCAGAGAPALGRASRHLGEPRRPVALGGDGRLQADRGQRAARAQGSRRARRRRLRAREDRRLWRASPSRRSRSSSGTACRSTRTGSARR